MVGAKGFEPSTSWSRTRRASQAALRPDNPQRQTNIAARNSRISQQSSIAYRPVSCYVHRALSMSVDYDFKQANAATLDSSATAFSSTLVSY